MSFEQLNEKKTDLQDNLKNAVDSSIAYYKLWFFKVLMKSVTMVVKILLMVCFFMMFLLFASVSLALYLGEVLENTALGFLLVGSIYMFLMLIAYFIRDKIVEGRLLEKFSAVFFNE